MAFLIGHRRGFAEEGRQGGAQRGWEGCLPGEGGGAKLFSGPKNKQKFQRSWANHHLRGVMTGVA